MKFLVKLTLLQDQLGTVTKDQNVYDTYIKTRAEGKETYDEFCSPLDEQETEELNKKGWTGFMEENGKRFILNYMIKGFLKNAGNVIKNDIGIKNLKSKINNYIFINPRKIFFNGENGEVCERPLQGFTPQGPRVALAKSDTIKEGATLEFELEIPYTCEIKQKHLEQLFDYGRFQGLGQWRNAGYGRFNYELKEIR